MTSQVDNVSSRIITGRLVHPSGKPIRNQKIALAAPGWFKNIRLAETATDKKGHFKLTCQWDSKAQDGFKNLLLEVYQETLPSEKSIKERMTDAIPLRFPNQETSWDFKRVETSLYERQRAIPILKIAPNSSRRPEQHTLSYRLKLLLVALPNKFKELVLNAVSGIISTNIAQKVFGAEDPSLQISEETTIDMLLNGLTPCNFKTSKKGHLLYEIKWDNFEKDESADLPNVSIKLNNMEGALSIKNVKVQYSKEKSTVYNPEDKEFKKGLYLFNSMAIIEGEARYHLGRGHLMTGQLARAFFENIKSNPIKKLLTPHFDGVAEINRLGAGLIFGEMGVLNVSGLSAKGVDQILSETLSRMDFADFKPRKPLCETHRFAKAQELYWEVVTNVVKRFFKENKKEIRETWDEVYYMSSSLTENSLPYHSPHKDLKKGQTWFDENEIDDRKFQTRLTDKAIRPITISKKVPAKGDLKRLKQFCSYALFTATFYHYALHTSQGKWATNLSFGSIAPSNRGNTPFGGTKPGSGIRQLAVVQTLINFKAEPLIEDPFKSIYPPLIEAIKEKQQAFFELGYDMKKMHYGVVI